MAKCFRNVNSFALMLLGISLESVCVVDAKAINALNQLFYALVVFRHKLEMSVFTSWPLSMLCLTRVNCVF